MTPAFLAKWLRGQPSFPTIPTIEKLWTRSTSRGSSGDEDQPVAEQPHRPSRSSKPVSDKQAWLQVAVNFLVMFNSFGLIQSFGIFQLPYEKSLESTPSTVAWIGSIHIFFVYFFGTFSGCALDRGYYKSSLATGSMLQIIGLIVAGFSNNYWMTFIFHGVFQGVGHGLMFCPAVTMTANYFHGSAWKMMALGIAGCGASVGGMVFPAIAKFTINTLGIGKTLWIMCGVVTVLSILIQMLALIGPPKFTPTNTGKTRKKIRRSAVDWKAFKEPCYTLYVVAMFFVFIGLWIPFFYVREVSAKALDISKDDSFTILILLNAAGIPGRLAPALLADRYIGTINTYIINLFLTSITLLCWPRVATTAGMYPWAIAYGFGAGGVSSLLQAGIASLNQEHHKTGVKIGMAFTIVGFASLVGGPVGGELIQVGEHGSDDGMDAFLPMMLFTGSIMLLGCAILVIARVTKTGSVFKVKV
ncbi:MFS general substrate transporter [Ophiobolus disseminans]|uniref:MFS general substrate transporter n=1 Tax=Ophiobolus disseminans TaxID=1469910 RepID=A0A6A6ZJL3_9PLEO|nr:MFS general substrate transporter [Ophiobolus disseminans]